MSNQPCPFSDEDLTYGGSPAEQARCLLRKVNLGGNVDNAPAVLPAYLESLIGQPVDFAREQLLAYLQNRNIAEDDIGGALADPLCRTSSGKTAAYFVIHDTSDELAGNHFPANINTPGWDGNDLATRDSNKVHLFLNRLGQSKTVTPYHRKNSSIAIKFEGTTSTGHGAPVRGLFLHHELIQPRTKGNQSYHAIAPDPGFTPATYERLALCYLAASVRKGEWLIPAQHCVLDLQQRNSQGKLDWHDDPQNFDLNAWNDAIASLHNTVKGASLPADTPLLTSDALKGDPTLEAVARSHAKLVPSQMRSPAVARVQLALNRLSVFYPAYGIDLGPGDRHAGYYGSKTSTAINALQRNHAMVRSGEIGSSTILALDAQFLHLLERPAGEVRLAGEHADHGAPTGPPSPWRTSAGRAEDEDHPEKGYASTTGIHGTHQAYADGSVISTGEETLKARRRNTTYPDVVARQTRILANGTEKITQTGYCRGNRQLPDAVFIHRHPGLTGPDTKRGYSTVFGKSDNADEGTGSEEFGIVQTSSEVCGCSVPKSTLIEWFGRGYATDPRRLTTLVEIFFTRNNRYACVPLTDVGPSPSSPAIIDLTWAVDQFLGTDGGDEDYDVIFRPIIA